MPAHDTPAAPALAATWWQLLAAYRPVVRQERVFVRLVHLSVAAVLGFGRQSVAQLLVVLGCGEGDWRAWYRLFNHARIDLDRLQATVLAQALAAVPLQEPALVVAVAGTQVPRSSRRCPGCGYTIQARTPKWRRGIHLAQRFVGASLLLPRSAQGDSRAVPLRWLLLRTAKTTPMGDAPERTERQGALDLVAWLRARLDALGRSAQPLLVLGDGAYSNAVVLSGLPARVGLFARCAKNRALFAPPIPHGGRGRPRRYGERGATPSATLHTDGGWHDHTFMVRGRAVTVTAKTTGPWLVRGAPDQPVLLVVVRGVDRGRGGTRRQRDPQYVLASLCPTGGPGTWGLAVPLAELLAWAGQRWEVEVMHRELKSGFGLGEQQAWSERGAATVVPWLVWVYALVVLAGYRTWGYAPPPGPDRGGWWRPRRWSVGRLRQGLRQDLWQLGDVRPAWARSPDAWAEMAAWAATRMPATLGARRR